MLKKSINSTSLRQFSNEGAVPAVGCVLQKSIAMKRSTRSRLCVTEVNSNEGAVPAVGCVLQKSIAMKAQYLQSAVCYRSL